MYQIGDLLQIEIIGNDYRYIDNLVITYNYKGILVSCGHCLPTNAKISFGKIIYTSGFDNSDEGKEISLITLKDYYAKSIYNIIDNKSVIFDKSLLFTKGSLVFNYFQRKKTFGYISQIITKKHDLQDLKWQLESHISKLDYPYYLIEAKNFSKTINSKKLTYFQSIFNKHKKSNDLNIEKEGRLTHPGCSGSPWIIKSQSDQKYYLL